MKNPGIAKQALAVTIAVFITAAYLLLSVGCFIDGISDTISGYSYRCRETRRIDFVFPARKLGCWLGETI